MVLERRWWQLGVGEAYPWRGEQEVWCRSVGGGGCGHGTAVARVVAPRGAGTAEAGPW